MANCFTVYFVFWIQRVRITSLGSHQSCYFSMLQWILHRMHRFSLCILQHLSGNTLVKTLPSPPPTSTSLYCLSSDNCLQQTMSCRHLAPWGTRLHYHSLPNTHTCEHTTNRAWVSEFACKCVWVDLCVTFSCPRNSGAACSGVYVCHCMHTVMPNYYCVSVSWCCLSIFPHGPSLLWLVLLKQQTVWANTNTHLHRHGDTWTHTRAHTQSRRDPRLIETETDLVKLREQPEVVCRPRGIRPRVTKNTGVTAKISANPPPPLLY